MEIFSIPLVSENDSAARGWGQGPKVDCKGISTCKRRCEKLKSQSASKIGWIHRLRFKPKPVYYSVSILSLFPRSFLEAKAEYLLMFYCNSWCFLLLNRLNFVRASTSLPNPFHQVSAEGTKCKIKWLKNSFKVENFRSRPRRKSSQ